MKSAAPTRCDRLGQLIVETEVRITRLTSLIVELTERGQDPSRAEDLVRQFQELIDTWLEWRLELRLIEEPSAFKPMDWA